MSQINALSRDDGTGYITQKLYEKQKKNSIHDVLPSLLMNIFEKELQAVLWSEKALSKAIPPMIRNITCQTLADAMTRHLAQSGLQVARLNQIFKSLNINVEIVKSSVLQGLIRESEVKMEIYRTGNFFDSRIITTCIKIEHFEIECYETLCQMAESLGLSNTIVLLQASLYEKLDAHEKLNELAVSAIIARICQEDDDEKIGFKLIQHDNLQYARTSAEMNPG